jgi:hypothetical protein
MAEKVKKLPNGTLGITLALTNESQEEDAFHPTDPRLTAVNVNGDPECGSLVYDLNDQSEFDRDRGARLQSAFRVIKEPLGMDNAIGFQLSDSGQGDTSGGWFIDKPDGVLILEGRGAVQVGNQIGIGMGSHRANGPFHVGSAEDKHQKGQDADGNPINCLHIAHDFNLYQDKTKDGPLFIETFLPPGPDLDQRVPVHFGYNFASDDWRWYTTSALYPMPTPFPIPLPLPKDLPLQFDQGPGQPLRPPVPTLSNVVTGSSLTGAALRLMASLSTLVCPAVAVRPQNYQTGQANSGMFESPPVATPGSVSDDEAQNAMAQMGEERRKKADNSSPLTGMCSGFGAQGGTYQNSGSNGPDYHGSEGDPWVYTTIPRGSNQTSKPTSKFPGGTASGGIIYHPPETDLRDISVGLVPPNTSLSTMYILVGPGAFFGAGLPQLVTGGLKDGWSWGMDTSTADLKFRTHVSSGNPSTGIVFVNSSQNIRWYSGQSTYGEFDHANSANRTYTFPDKSGTVAMTSDISSGSSALFTATATVTYSGSGSDTTLVGAGQGSMTLPAAYPTVGKTVRLTARGYYSTVAVPGNLNIKVTVGGATFGQTGNQALPALMTNQLWKVELIFTCYTTGVGGTAWSQGDFTHMETAGSVGSPTLWELIRTAAQGIDTTSTNLVDLLANFDTAGNSITMTNLVLEGLN